ncbi:FAD-dependent oxidoreductase [Lichenihabitans sp. Uapishka_5]|uniref:FAD-dependent oxidoreductase n=1 Tax=Lichenihabitans sp. Uapishka_5 TaxID=3037302 RepID=UPI0029E8065E|nr:FAD-dependent oxidoreductase [Lichenihabitans sp. Uapishka_5]MDX7953002.1 FAD-dependent oxidoreductase [Lichenihabitans sp. Uapishka_5]
MHVTVIGAGAAGLVAATELMERGASVTVLERGREIGAGATSWYAGGMLAPWCEREGADAAVLAEGRLALDWWPKHFAGTVQAGTLVVTPPRDAAELQRFARRTSGFTTLDAAGVAALEPDLEGRFRQGLFFADEAHLDPRAALRSLAVGLVAHGAAVRLGVSADEAEVEADAVVDSRGVAGRDRLPALRGVRGEMVMVRTTDVTLSRPVRFLHPRVPLYIVPRGDGRFMVGATMIESDAAGPMTVRSALELLNAAYALHPAFAEAAILEFGAGVRPAYADNLPRLVRDGRVLRLNGMHRHGFLLSPWLARQAAEALFPMRSA